MRRACLTLLTLFLSSCGSPSTRLVVSARVPVPVELGQQIAELCPPARQLPDPLVSTLATEDSELAVDYAKCQERHRAAVKAYNDSREATIKFKADIEAEEKK